MGRNSGGERAPGLQYSDGMLARHIGKIIQKFVKWFAPLDIVVKRLDQHARAGENGAPDSHSGETVISGSGNGFMVVLHWPT
jgi:hypothetical protein